MPIQTSQITTETNGNLSISPNGTGETLISSVDVTRADAGTTEDTPVSVAPDGTIKKVDLSTLPEISTDNLVATDLIAVQKADGDFFYVKAEDLSSAGLINPDPGGGGNATLSVTPTPGSGAGTAASPFVLTSVTVTESGGTEQTVETFAISGAPANGILYVTFTDNQGGRFQDKVVVADAAGNVPAFTLTFIDEPESTVGTVYTGKVRFGTASTYFQWAVTQQAASTDFKGSDGSTDAPNASPSSVAGNGYFGTGSGTWSDGTKTLSSTTNVQFQVNGGGYGNGPTTANNGDTVDIIFLQSAVDGAADGATITGDLTSADSTFAKTFTMIKDASPTVNIGSSSNAALSTSSASADTTPTGFNSTLTVAAGTAGANEMTNILVSINGGAYSALPQTMAPGDTLSVQGDTGSASNTTYTANILVGSTAVTYSATTSATTTTPTISKPSITSPVDGSTDLIPDISLASSSYTGNDNPGPHTSSDWEVYEGPAGDPSTWTGVDGTSAAEWGMVQYGGNKWVVLSQSNGTNMHSSDGTTWTAGTAATSQYWTDMAYGNGTWVAVSQDGAGGRAMYSTDGSNWTLSTTPSNPNVGGNGVMRGVSSDGSKFVACGENNMVMYSFDGINWAVPTSLPSVPTNEQWNHTAFGAGVFVLYSQAGRTAYSSDGINWTRVDPAFATSAGGGFCFANGLFVAISGGDPVSYSSDGINWQSGGTSPTSCTDIDGGDGTFIAVGGSDSVATSTDGINWTSVTGTGNNLLWRGVGFGNGTFVAAADNNGALSPPYTERIMYAVGSASAPTTEPPDSSTYTQVVNAAGDTSNLTSYTLTSSEVQDGKAYYSRVKYNDDGSTGSTISSDFSDFNEFTGAALVLPDTWGSASGPYASRWQSVTYANGKFVAVARNGDAFQRVMYSSDGISWTAATSPSESDWSSITYGNSKFVAVSESGPIHYVMHSSDGITWSGLTTGTYFSWRSVTFGNGTFVAVATDGNKRIMYSTDATFWIEKTAPELNEWQGVTYGNGTFVAVASSGTNRVMYSSDGISWSSAAAASDIDWRSVAYGGGKFVAVANQGGTSRTMYSTDGITWTAGTMPLVANWRSVAYGAGKFTAVAEASPAPPAGLVAYSTDGITWTSADAPNDATWTGVTYGSDKFVAVNENRSINVMYSFA